MGLVNLKSLISEGFIKAPASLWKGRRFRATQMCQSSGIR